MDPAETAIVLDEHQAHVLWVCDAVWRRLHGTPSAFATQAQDISSYGWDEFLSPWEIDATRVPELEVMIEQIQGELGSDIAAQARAVVMELGTVARAALERRH